MDNEILIGIALTITGATFLYYLLRLPSGKIPSGSSSRTTENLRIPPPILKLPTDSLPVRQKNTETPRSQKPVTRTVQNKVKDHSRLIAGLYLRNKIDQLKAATQAEKPQAQSRRISSVEILRLAQNGCSELEIAQSLKLGRDEVAMVLRLNGRTR